MDDMIKNANAILKKMTENKKLMMMKKVDKNKVVLRKTATSKSKSKSRLFGRDGGRVRRRWRPRAMRPPPRLSSW